MIAPATSKTYVTIVSALVESETIIVEFSHDVSYNEDGDDWGWIVRYSLGADIAVNWAGQSQTNVVTFELNESIMGDIEDYIIERYDNDTKLLPIGFPAFEFEDAMQHELAWL
jgi:hypothetical protein